MNIGQHRSKKYNQELEDLRSQVLVMGGLVESQAGTAFRALLEQDIQLARKVSTSDYKINNMEIEIDKICTQILARRQPAASDLRLVITVIKIISDLERIGDEAEDIARTVSQWVDKEPNSSMYQDLKHLGELVISMLNHTLDAFARLDVDNALHVVGLKKQLKSEFDALSRLSITYMMEDPSNIKTALSMTWCARSLGRIGDHSMNISEYLIYLVRGKDIRHTSYQQIRDKLSSQ